MILKWLIDWFKKPPKPPESVNLGIYSLCVDHEYSKGNYVVLVSDEHFDNANCGLHDWCVQNKCQYGCDRVLWDKWVNRWASNGIGGRDELFVIAKDADSAILAKLVWG